MENLVYSTERPKIDGYYYVIWEEGDKPELIWISYSVIDDEDCWFWGWNEEDDPEAIETDISNPENIKFSQLIEKK